MKQCPRCKGWYAGYVGTLRLLDEDGQVAAQGPTLWCPACDHEWAEIDGQIVELEEEAA